MKHRILTGCGSIFALVAITSFFVQTSKSSSIDVFAKENIQVLTQGELTKDKTYPKCYFNFDNASIWNDDSWVLICTEPETQENCVQLFCHDYSNTYNCIPF